MNEYVEGLIRKPEEEGIFNYHPPNATGGIGIFSSEQNVRQYFYLHGVSFRITVDDGCAKIWVNQNEYLQASKAEQQRILLVYWIESRWKLLKAALIGCAASVVIALLMAMGARDDFWKIFLIFYLTFFIPIELCIVHYFYKNRPRI